MFRFAMIDGILGTDLYSLNLANFFETEKYFEADWWRKDNFQIARNKFFFE